jgi:hypothetical protein
VTLRGIAIGDEKELWSLEISAPVPFVTEGPMAGTVLHADGASIVTADATSGAELARTPVDDAAALAATMGNDRLAVVETRTARGASEARVTMRAYPTGTLIWSTAWLAGDLLSGDKSLRVSPEGSVIAVNLAPPTGARTHLVRSTDGGDAGDTDGRTIGFTADGVRALVVEAPPGTPRAYRIADELVAEERFGSPNTSASFLDVARNRLWAFDAGGTIRVYDLELGWSPTLEDAGRHERAGHDLDAGVPRFELHGP